MKRKISENESAGNVGFEDRTMMETLLNQWENWKDFSTSESFFFLMKSGLFSLFLFGLR